MPEIWLMTLRCSGDAKQRRQAAVGQHVFAALAAIDDPLDRFFEHLGIGVDRVEGLAHQPEEVLAQPRNPGELRPVRDLVQREPQPELFGREAMLLLERHHVGPDVVHDVLIFGILVFDDQQVVLAEHAARHPAEQNPDLETADRPADPAETRVARSSFEFVGDRPQQALERIDVGADPHGPIGDACAGVSAVGPQPGFDRNQLFGLGGEAFEVGLERGVVVRRRAWLREAILRRRRAGPTPSRLVRPFLLALLVPLGVPGIDDLEEVADDHSEHLQDG